MEALKNALASAIEARATAAAAAEQLTEKAKAAAITKAVDPLRRAALAASEARTELESKSSGRFGSGPAPAADEVEKVTAAELAAWDAYIKALSDAGIKVDATA